MIKYELMRAHGKGSEGSEKRGGVRKERGCEKKGGARQHRAPPRVYATVARDVNLAKGKAGL